MLWRRAACPGPGPVHGADLRRPPALQRRSDRALSDRRRPGAPATRRGARGARQQPPERRHQVARRGRHPAPRRHGGASRAAVPQPRRLHRLVRRPDDLHDGAGRTGTRHRGRRVPRPGRVPPLPQCRRGRTDRAPADAACARAQVGRAGACGRRRDRPADGTCARRDRDLGPYRHRRRADRAGARAARPLPDVVRRTVLPPGADRRRRPALGAVEGAAHAAQRALRGRLRHLDQRPLVSLRIVDRRRAALARRLAAGCRSTDRLGQRRTPVRSARP
jgi:hypothetical protein